MAQPIKTKVCGMRSPENVAEIKTLGIDFMGFIFFSKSARFVTDKFEAHIPLSLNPETKAVGVFVNAEANYILSCAKRYGLEYIQLHGGETPEFCQQMQEKGLQVIKAFGVDEGFDFEQLNAYELVIDYFLFDTKTKLHGGSGIKFSWQVLQNYSLTTPFFLSGGIGPDDVQAVFDFNHPQLYALDLNSKFEDRPAQKNVPLLRQFLTKATQKQIK